MNTNTNTAKKYNALAYTDDEIEYIDDMFRDPWVDGEMFFYSPSMGSKHYSTGYLEMHNIETLSIGCRRGMFTPNIFKNGTKSRTASKLLSIRTFALDVDYKQDGVGVYGDCLHYYQAMVSPTIGTIIPEPTYVEYGHCIRLIYMLESPVKSALGTNMVKLLTAVQRGLAGALSREIGAVVEAQPFNSYYRLPLSINEKDGATVRVIKTSDIRWTVQEMANEFLPDLPDWYENWKGKKNVATTISKNGGIAKINNAYAMWCSRLEWLAEHQNVATSRELFLHLYAQGLLWTNRVATADELVDELIIINKRFDNPLLEKEIKSKFRTEFGRRYKYSNQRISEMLGIEMTTKARVRRKPEDEKHLKSKQRNSEIISLLNSGMSVRKIAEKLKISPSTVMRAKKKL